MSADRSQPAQVGTAAEELLRRGSAFLVGGQPRAAIPLFREALVMEPGLADAYAGLGRALVACGRRTDAGRVFRRAGALFPGDPRFDDLPGRSLQNHRPAFLAPRPAARTNDAPLRRRARMLGFLGFGFVLYAYLAVGVRTHFTLGLVVAGAVGIVLSLVGSLAFRRRRSVARRSILQGMICGFVATLLVGVFSIAIAIGTYARAGTASEEPAPATDVRFPPPSPAPGR